MSRHRDIRRLDYSEDFGEDIYGRSLEDDYAVSPTSAQFIFNRENSQGASLMSYMSSKEPVPISPLNVSTKSDTPIVNLDVKTVGISNMSDVQLDSGIQYIRNVVGYQFSEEDMVDAMRHCNMDAEAALNQLLERGSKHEKGPKRALTLDDSVLSHRTKVVVSGSKPTLGFHTPTDDHSRSPRALSPCSSNHTPVSGGTPDSGARELTLDSASKRSLPPRNKHKHIDVIAEYKKKLENDRPILNLVIVGHVDAGKSTLMGHLLYKLGHVSKKTMHKYEKESTKVGKASFAFAWVLDETGEERNRGITMDVGVHMFTTDTKNITLLDAPGHKDFIPNMISGAAQADVAILVVDATTGEFEAGFEAGGQTREHAILVRSLGVRQIIVAVNKMDMVDYSETRFNEIFQKLRTFLKQIGFKDSDVRYLPCSGYTGENLLENPSHPELIKWCNGPPLMKLIDTFDTPTRPIEKPFRCSVADIFKGQGAGFSVSGRIESGSLQQGDNLLVLPANEYATVRGLMINEDTVPWAVAGDHIVITLQGIDITKMNVGSVLSEVEKPARVCTIIQARVLVFDIEFPITQGYPVLFHHQSIVEPATVHKLVSQLHRSTGEVVKKKPRCIVKNSTALIQLEVSRPICVETYEDCKGLGRFMLRYSGNTIATGIITKIVR
ncbi:HBS1-like protein [Dysidea avara]|uniref:HBS1-like protein n=1 Tax=Dysidea avara TaxID=196820 RepID=UPI003323FF20